MKKNAWVICMVLAATTVCFPSPTTAALVLTGGSYGQNFDGVGSGLPTGWGVYSGASASTLGSAASFNTTITSWGGTSPGGFYNVASTDGLSASSDVTAQSASTDRALGFRQVNTGNLDPGAAVVLNIQDTVGLGNFALSLKVQFLDNNGRSTDLVVDYRIGNSGAFTTLTTYPDPNTFGSTTISLNSTDLTAWNNQSSEIWFRIVALNASTGSGSRDTFGIDDFSLSYSPVPEPTSVALGLFGVGLLAVSGTRAWLRARRTAL